MLLGPVRTHLTTWAGNTDCIAKINSRGERRDGYGPAPALLLVHGAGVLFGHWNYRTITTGQCCCENDSDYPGMGGSFV